MPSIVVAGGYGMGLTMLSPRFPEPGETVTGGRFQSGPGGKGSNQAVAARRLGAEVELFTCVGADDFGEAGRELWRREGVGTQAVRTGSLPTMVGTILVDATGENRIIVAPGALEELTVSDVAALEPILERADACVVSLEIPTHVAVAVLELARDAGALTILNPAPAADLPPEVWPLVDVATPNRLEAATLTGMRSEDDPRLLVDRLRTFFTGVVVLTLGSDGALVDDGYDRWRHPAPTPSRVVDTTGAGDAFTAALAVELAEKRPLTSAVATALAAGTHVVGRTGVIPALPTREQLDAALDGWRTSIDPAHEAVER
ncbi:MAG TPA: ribokinase [Actinopolymorphaceae bacterium]|jgi:ribokinase